MRAALEIAPAESFSKILIDFDHISKMKILIYQIPDEQPVGC